MLVKIQIFVILSAIVALSNSTELPDYIKTCRRDDPNLNQCFKTNANLALKSLQYGDENLGIPKFSGVSVLDTLTLQPLKELPFSLVIKNCKVYGLETLSLTNVKIDLQLRHMDLDFIGPKVVWQCQYVAQANILLDKLIQTSGSYNLTFKNGEYAYKIDYDLKNINGKDYIVIKSDTVEFTSVELTHVLENIESNEVINGFWEQTKPHFVTPDLLNVCSGIGTKVLNYFFNVFTYNQIFP